MNGPPPLFRGMTCAAKSPSLRPVVAPISRCAKPMSPRTSRPSPGQICFTSLLLWLGLTAASAQVIRPIPVPGRIEAENYDTNGPGISFYDNTAGNSGGVYRTDDVDIEATTDAGGGYNVGWIATGEWLNFTINVQTTAVYQIAFRVASASGTGNIQLNLDGLPFCSVATPLTGGWQTWQTVTVSNLVLPAGLRQLRMSFLVGGQNVNYLHVTKQRDLTGGYLRVSGQQIVDGLGRNVVLRGYGLGNWMLQEPYMMDASGLVNNQQQLRAKIAELVGTTNRDAFYAAWLTNYIREADVAALATAGFNSIRLPMHYNLFTLPIEQEPVPGQNTWLTNGFKLVDDLLTWCEAHQIYLILDMHACPGGQGHDQPISDYNPPAPSLWENSTNRIKLVALWRELASRYANREWIGGYDLINEPNWTFENKPSAGGCDDQTNAPLRQLLMDCTAAIRQVDTNHLIFLAGNCWGGNYNGVLPPWDNNLVLSFHKYWDQPTAASLQPWVDRRNQWNLPVWLGESGENWNEWFRDVIRNAEQANIGWAWWPWKKIGTISGPVMIQKPAGYQAILDYWGGSGPRPSTNTASAALMALAQAARFENCIVHPDVLDALLRPDPQGQTLPFKSNAIPGRIFAADYDLGQPGAAYFDQSTNGPQNTGGLYRNDAVDIEACTDSAPTLGYDVGWTEAGDWMKYTAPGIAPGPYAVSVRVASGSGGGSFHLELGGSNVTGAINISNTGGWQNWTTTPPRAFTNAMLTDSFKLIVDAAGFNLHWLQFSNLAPAAPTGLNASATSTQVHLSWNSVPGATGYRVRRALTSGGTRTVIAANVAGLTHFDAAVTNGQTYYYLVSALNNYGEGSVSNEAAAPVPFPRLSASLAADQVALSWSNAAVTLRLRSATNLLPPIVWLPVTNAPLFQNGLWQLVWSPGDSPRFFRLAVE